MRAATLGMILVGTSVADERAFPCINFRKKQLADTSVTRTSPFACNEASRMVRSWNISIPHVDFGWMVLLAWRFSGKLRCLFVKKMHACLKLTFNTEQKNNHDRAETKLVYMLTSMWETSQISLLAYIGKCCLPFPVLDNWW
jgi:hypothetical protein